MWLIIIKHFVPGFSSCLNVYKLRKIILKEPKKNS
jgi:hypothetical protein